MKVFVTKASKWRRDGEVREYESLEECIKTLLKTEDFGKFAPEVIVSEPDDFLLDNHKECDYEVEIYDTWRE